MYKLVSLFSLLFSLFSCPSIGQGYKEYITCVIDCCVATLFRTWHSGWRLEESRIRVRDTNTAKNLQCRIFLVLNSIDVRKGDHWNPVFEFSV